MFDFFNHYFLLNLIVLIVIFYVSNKTNTTMKKARKQNRKYLRGRRHRITDEQATRLMIRDIAKRFKVPYVCVQPHYGSRTRANSI